MKSLILALLAVSVAGLDVGSVNVVDGLRYLTYGHVSENTSRILCDYEVTDGQEVSNVLWEILKDGNAAGTFQWSSDAQAFATGLLEGMVNLGREDSDLEFTALTYDLGANYTCTVTAKDGETGTAAEEILVVDTTSNYIYEATYMNEDDCIMAANMSYYPVFPRPTVTSGLYSDTLGDYYEKVTNWEAVVHENGSVGFSYGTYVFQINENTPDDFTLRSEIGVTKSDGTYIPFSTTTIYFYFQHSCKVLDYGETKTVSYNSEERTCFGEPFYSAGYVEAQIECAEGFISTGIVSSVTMVCERTDSVTYEWVPKYDEFVPEDLICDKAVL